MRIRKVGDGPPPPPSSALTVDVLAGVSAAILRESDTLAVLRHKGALSAKAGLRIESAVWLLHRALAEISQVVDELEG